MKKPVKFIALVIVIAATLCSTISAQSFKATVVGKVTDAAGAIVPGASVTITQEGTNFTQTVTTNDDGEYVLSQLDPGSYTIKVEYTNFKTMVRPGIALETRQSLRYDFVLETGSVSETVTVQDIPSAINTETSSKGEVITPRQVQDLPLNGRNFTDLALLAPGVYKRPADDDQGEGLATAGTRTDAANFILDGVVNKSDRNGSVGVNTSVDSIREFKVETSTYTAEFGRSAGAQVNVVSKSGTNKFHGTLFDYVRNDAFDARNALAVDIEETPGDDGKKTLRRNQFGGTIGGPMPFFNFGENDGPVFTNGRDRTFFFFSYEGTRETRSKTAFTTAPRASWLRGDFRDILGAGPDLVLGTGDDVAGSNDIRCLQLNPTNPLAASRVVCPTPNVIPTMNTVVGSNTILGINPLSRTILARIPSANVVSSLTPFGYAVTLPGETNRDQTTLKIDHSLNSVNTASFRFSQQSGTGFDPFPSARNFWPTFGRDTIQKYRNIGFSDTHLFSPTLINEARVGIYTQRSQNLGENRDVDYITQFGITGLPTGTGAQFQGYPAIRIDGFSEFGDRPNDPFVYDLQNLQFYDAITAVMGNHSFKFGVDFIRSNYNEADVRNVRGDFRFRGRNTNPSGGTAGATRSGPGSFADFLYGLPDATQRQIGADPADLTGWQYAFFIQDDWRVKDWLTLNLGLRYERQTSLTEATNRLTNFIPELGTSVIAGDPRYPRGLIFSDKNNWGPRVGFALRPFRDDKTVIRGGAGIYYSLETFNPIRQQLAVSFPFIQRETWNRVAAQPLLLTFQNPFAGTGGIQGVTTPFGMQANYQTPEIYQYNLTLERELMKDLALEIGYVGSQGRHLGIRYNLNAPYPNGTINAAGLPNTTRRFTTLGDIQYQDQVANSSYDALQTSLRRRSRQGLTLLVSYTFSKAMDNASSTNNSSLGSQKFPQDIRNFAAEHALADFHRTHQFTASFNYDIPIGRGRTYLRDAGGITDALLGGWQVNGIVSLLSGRPFTPTYSTADVAQQRPDLIGDPYANIPAGLAFNPGAFRRPVATAASPEVFGNAGRNILTGPSFQSVDLSLMKNFRLTESAKIQFRAEAFNVLNHANFQVPVFLLDASNVGQYSLTAGENRELQFALKLIF